MPRDGDRGRITLIAFLLTCANLWSSTTEHRLTVLRSPLVSQNNTLGLQTAWWRRAPPWVGSLHHSVVGRSNPPYLNGIRHYRRSDATDRSFLFLYQRRTLLWSPHVSDDPPHPPFSSHQSLQRVFWIWTRGHIDELVPRLACVWEG